MHVEKLKQCFVVQGEFSSFHWRSKECGLRISCPQGALSPSDESYDIAAVALAGGQFKLPVGTKLVSAVYGISVSKALLKPLTLELQHCVALETKAQADNLKFIKAPLIGYDFNAEFTVMEGGEFCLGSRYGSMTCDLIGKFYIAVVQKENLSMTGIKSNLIVNIVILLFQMLLISM